MNNGLSQEINSLIRDHIKSHISNKAETPDLSKDLGTKDIWFVLKEFIDPNPKNVRRGEFLFNTPPLKLNPANIVYLYFVFLEGDSEYFSDFDGLYWIKSDPTYFSLDGKNLDKEELGHTYIKCDNFNHKEGDKTIARRIYKLTIKGKEYNFPNFVHYFNKKSQKMLVRKTVPKGTTEKGMESKKRKEEQKEPTPTKKVKQDTPVPPKRPKERKEPTKATPIPADDIIDATGGETGLEIHTPEVNDQKKEQQRRASETRPARKSQTQLKLQLQLRAQANLKQQINSKVQPQQAKTISLQSSPESTKERLTIKSQAGLSLRSPDEKLQQSKLPQIEIKSPEKAEEKSKLNVQPDSQQKAPETEKKDKTKSSQSHHSETKVQKTKEQAKLKQVSEEKQKTHKHKSSQVQTKQQQNEEEKVNHESRSKHERSSEEEKAKLESRSKQEQSSEENQKQDEQPKHQRKTKERKSKSKKEPEESSKQDDQLKIQQNTEEKPKQDDQPKSQPKPEEQPKPKQKTKSTIPIPPPKKPRTVVKGTIKGTSGDKDENAKLPSVVDLTQMKEKDNSQDPDTEIPHLNDSFFNLMKESVGMLKKFEAEKSDSTEPLMLDENSSGNAFEQYMKKDNTTAPHNSLGTTFSLQDVVSNKQISSLMNDQTSGTQVHNSPQQQSLTGSNLGTTQRANNPQSITNTPTKGQDIQYNQLQLNGNSLPFKSVQTAGLQTIQTTNTTSNEMFIDLTNSGNQGNQAASTPQTTLNGNQTSSSKTPKSLQSIIPRSTNPNIVSVNNNSPSSVQQIRNLNSVPNNTTIAPLNQNTIATKNAFKQTPAPIAGRSSNAALTSNFQNPYVMKQQDNPQVIVPGGQGMPNSVQPTKTQAPYPYVINFPTTVPSSIPGQILISPQPIPNTQPISFNPTEQRNMILQQQIQALSQQKLQAQVPQHHHHRHQQNLQQYNQNYAQTLQPTQQMQSIPLQKVQVAYIQPQPTGYIQQNQAPANFNNFYSHQQPLPEVKQQQHNFKQIQPQPQPQQQPQIQPQQPKQQSQIQPQQQQPQIQPQPQPQQQPQIQPQPQQQRPQIQPQQPKQQVQIQPQQQKQQVQIQPQQQAVSSSGVSSSPQSTKQSQPSLAIQTTGQNTGHSQQVASKPPQSDASSGNAESSSNASVGTKNRNVYSLIVRSCPEGESHNIAFLCYPEAKEITIDSRPIKFRKLGEFVHDVQKNKMFMYEIVMTNNLRAGIYKLRITTSPRVYESDFYITPNGFKRELRCRFTSDDDTYINTSLSHFKAYTRILDISNSGLNNLSYLEGFSLLKRLNFSGNQLNPNTVIPELKRLKHIDLSNNKISDLNSLQIILSDMKDRFPKLKTLKLTKNPVAVMPDFSEIVKETFPSFKYDVKKDLFVYDESMSE